MVGVAAATTIGFGLVVTHLRHVDITVQGPTGTRSIKLWTFRSRVKRILAQAHVRTGPHDKISLGLNQTITNKPLVVKEAIPILVKTAHRHFRYWTTEYQVGAVLKTLGIKLGPLDEVIPKPGKTVRAQSTVQVIRRWFVEKSVYSALPFGVQYQADPNLYKGHDQVVSAGADGKAVTVVQYLVQNGVPVKSHVISHSVVTPPRNEVVRYGTKELVARGGQVLQFSQQFSMVSTGYWPDPRWSDGYTTIGLKAQYGVVAVDPRVIPLGTRLYIPGYGFAVAADTGSAIVGDRIDLCFNSEGQAVGWGVRTVNVFVLE